MERHGLRFGIERIDDSFFLTMTVSGKLTHEDYQQMTPMLDRALEGIEHPRIRALVDIRELRGWEMRAAWDDLKLGLKHGRSFEKIAIVGSQRWLEAASRVGGWFTGGEVRQFDTPNSALEWLTQEGGAHH